MQGNGKAKVVGRAFLQTQPSYREFAYLLMILYPFIYSPDTTTRDYKLQLMNLVLMVHTTEETFQYENRALSVGTRHQMTKSASWHLWNISRSKITVRHNYRHPWIFREYILIKKYNLDAILFHINMIPLFVSILRVSKICMENSAFRSDGQEIIYISWNLHVYCHVHKRPPLDIIKFQLNSI